MAHEIHIRAALTSLLLFESAAFLLSAVVPLAKWTRYYSNIRSGWGVAFHSEARFEFYGWIITLNGVGLVVFVLWAFARWMGLSFAW